MCEPKGGTTITGRVCAGRGEAAGFVLLPWVLEQIRERAGFSPYPGTLNLRLSDQASLALWRRLRRFPGFVLEPPQPSFCSAACFLTTLPGNLRGIVVHPHVPSYPEDLIEVIAAVRLRDRLGLRDGDRLRLVLGEE